MSEADRKWLQEVMEAYTFNDADRLKEICEEMRKDVDSNFTFLDGAPAEGETLEYKKTLDLLDECQELVEMHERNNLNLAILGGLNSIIQYILRHPDDEVRKIACNTFSQVVQNNAEPQ